MRKILAYGTLKEGHYNFEYYKSRFPEIKKTGDMRISGYEMYDYQGLYPMAVPAIHSSIQCDVIDVSLRCFVQMIEMERGAGYTPVEVSLNGGVYVIFVYTDELPPFCEKVTSGNWTHDNYLIKQSN